MRKHLSPDKHYSIGRIEGTDTFVVGKDNSLTEVFHFKHLEHAIEKIIEMEGPEFVVRAVNSYGMLLDKSRYAVWAKNAIRMVDHALAKTPELE